MRRLQNLVDDAVGDRFLRGHEEVAVGRLAGVAPAFTAGASGSRIAHSRSVRSVGERFRFDGSVGVLVVSVLMPPVYHVSKHALTNIYEENGNSYEKTRIYHRYRIRGLRSALSGTPLTAITQAALPFISEEERDKVVSTLITTSPGERKIWAERFRQAAVQDAANLTSTLTPMVPSPFAGFDYFFAEHEEVTKQVIRLFSAEVPNHVRLYKFGVFSSTAGDPDIFLLNAQLKITDEFLRRLSTRGLTISHAHIDLQRLADDGTSIVRGGLDSRRNRDYRHRFAAGTVISIGV